jgi:short subunit dehydrogenase-like uncharacterized protein
MTGRVILFGATGYTGRLTAEAMTRAGLAPVLAGRSADALVNLVGDLAGLGAVDRAPTWQCADASDPSSVRALVTSPDDVLVSTVGPFVHHGRPAVEAAIDAGCAYVDSTGEAPFIREVFEVDGPRAVESGARLLTAFGYDYVPGNLAAAMAMHDAADTASGPVGVEVGYFFSGTTSMSSGTRATMAALMGEPPLALRNGAVVTTGGGVATFDLAHGRHQAIMIGASELFSLPRIDPRVRDVSVYLGWLGKWSSAAKVGGSAMRGIMRLPGVGGLLDAGVRRATSTTGEGPDRHQRAQSTSVAIARTVDGVGRLLSSARVEGPNGYDLTAELLAWAAAMLVTRQETGAGALGPVDAFGFAALESGCADIGLRRVGGPLSEEQRQRDRRN